MAKMVPRPEVSRQGYPDQGYPDQGYPDRGYPDHHGYPDQGYPIKVQAKARYSKLFLVFMLSLYSHNLKLSKDFSFKTPKARALD